MGTSGSDFLYVLRKNELIKLCVFTENGKRKQDAKSKKKLSAPEKSNLRNYAEKIKDYTDRIKDYTQPVKAG